MIEELGGDRTFFNELVQMFLQSVPHNLASLVKSLAQKEATEEVRLQLEKKIEGIEEYFADGISPSKE